MLTVKVIRPDGSEFVREVDGVDLNTSEQSETGRKSVSCWRGTPGGSNIIEIFCGTVWVMNESGKTIANYSLGNPPMECSG